MKNYDHFKVQIKRNVPKKQISLYLEDITLAQIEKVASIFSAIGNSKFTRNALIQEAVSKFILEADIYLKDTLGADIDTLIKEMGVNPKNN
ncbi:MAG: hypothetical protein FWB96_01300 [Defluviitaleaceae bacterium]|nr:hypothetical protein [Defluviitaleaceae bacterium]MCL2261671.1 hypothetical protein [Defluviitaleaceae bacterium]